MMEEYEFQHLLHTVPGIGVKAQTRYGDVFYYFFEDFPDSKGIDRAMHQIYNGMKMGTFFSAEFIENYAMHL